MTIKEMNTIPLIGGYWVEKESALQIVVKDGRGIILSNNVAMSYEDLEQNYFLCIDAKGVAQMLATSSKEMLNG